MIKLTLTDKQAEIVSRACEFFTRIRIGQFGEIIWNCAPKHYVKNPDAAEKAWLDLRKHIYPDLHGPGHSYGLGHFEDADTAYDVHQVIRYALGDKREPFSYNNTLPKCECVENDAPCFRGKWEVVCHYPYPDTMRCSVCKKEFDEDTSWKVCPKCMAVMDGGANNER